MNKNNNIEETKTGFKIPTGYFDSVEDKILLRLDQGKLEDNDKAFPYKVPANYFDSLEKEILDKIENAVAVDNKVKPLFNWKKAALLTGIAASIIIILNLNLGNNANIDFNDLNVSSIESYIMDENINAYELAQALKLEDFSIQGTEVEISDSEIEDYLLDNSKIEELIIE